MRIRLRTFVSVLGGAVLLAGCGSGTTVVPSASASTSLPPPGELLATFRPPPGAVRLTREPQGVPQGMRNPATEPMVDHLLVGTSWWTVSETPQQAESWFGAHPPSGAEPGAGISGSGPDVVVARSFDFRDQNGYQDRSLMMSAVSYHGGALLRVDAMEVDVGQRSAQNRVPSAAALLEARVLLPGRSPVTRKVTDLATVRQIATLTNALPLLPPGTRSCPAETGGSLTLDFYTPASRTPVATVTVALSGCRDALVSTPQNRPGTRLNAAPSDYGTQVSALLGITLQASRDPLPHAASGTPIPVSAPGSPLGPPAIT